MKILFICGSNRKGNTEYILNEIYSQIKIDKSIIYLNNKNIINCDGCLTCRKNLKCHINDDMLEIESQMRSCDIIVMGIPNYFDNIPGITKTFIDRCHSLYYSGELKSKSIYFIFVGGGKIEGTEKTLLSAMGGFIKYMGLDYIGNTTYQALEINDMKNKKIDALKIIEILEKKK
jgi:multimeric flavodoxin WrbA